MKIALIGSSGLVGSALREVFNPQDVVLIKRNKAGVYQFSDQDFDGIDAVINLAGSSISSRWSEAVKKEIKESRIKTTRDLSSVLKQLKTPPKVVINASAIGFYGNGGERLFDESSAPAHDFLSQVAQDWEKALQVPGVRTVFTRFGIILSPKGGALKKMLPPFKMGFGGRLGDGRQFMSWIAIEDVVHAIQHVLKSEHIEGPINFVSPHPVRNAEFTKTLGKVLNRPTVIPMPAFLIRLIFGEMGDALLLSSTRVAPKRLLETGYEFLYPDLEKALRKEI